MDGDQLIKPEKKQDKWLVLRIILLLIIILGLAGYSAYEKYQTKQILGEIVLAPPTVLSPSPDPINENLKEYSNKTFRIKYPKDMDLREENTGTVILSKRGPTQKEATEFYDGISLRLRAIDTADTNLETYVNKNVQEIKSGGMAEIVSGPNPITAGKFTGLTFISRGIGTYKYTYIQSPNKISLMEIIDSTIDPTNQGFKKITDDILSTIEFVN